ncbi:MAG: hypothetical protein EXX96DRAFT_643432 [Benjaminiella poitrasii]|nr:MAG: hypothetical protein EXX96DRAFT_643432 [Benjaminiella poitrasii]
MDIQVRKVLTFAIKAIFNELLMLKSKPTTYSACNYTCRVQYKIPCVHLLSLVTNNDTIPLSMVPRRWRIRYDEGEFDNYFQSQMISIQYDNCITETILLDYIDEDDEEEEMKKLPSSDLNNDFYIPSNDEVDSEELEKLQSLTAYTEASQNTLTPTILPTILKINNLYEKLASAQEKIDLISKLDQVIQSTETKGLENLLPPSTKERRVDADSVSRTFNNFDECPSVDSWFDSVDCPQIAADLYNRAIAVYSKTAGNTLFLPFISEIPESNKPIMLYLSQT